MKNLILVLAFISLGTNSIYCQTDKGADTKSNSWSATLSGGSMLFYGDLRQYSIYPVGKAHFPNISERKCGFELAVNKQFHSYFAIQGQFQNGKLSGFKREADAYFLTNFSEYGINAIINFRNMLFPNFANQKISVYGILGLGLINFKSIEKTISTDEVISSYGYDINGEKHAKTTETVIPIGIGAKYKINTNLDAGIEITMNNVITDKLDAHVVPGSKKDKYGYTCVAFTYKIGNRESSLEWDVAQPAPHKEKDTSTYVATNKIKDTTKVKPEKVKKVTETKTKKPPKVRAGQDSDNDGVPDKYDKCPNTPNFIIADANGCPPDEDQDGVGDYMDKCPNTPGDVKVDTLGCPLDSDHDGVADYLDNCPDTPRKAKVDKEGCPTDTDGDGVFDYLDKCPDTPKGKKVDAEGCPL